MLGCGKVGIPYTKANYINTLGLHLFFEPVELRKQVRGQKGQSSGSLKLHLSGQNLRKDRIDRKLTYFVGLRNFPPAISSQWVSELAAANLVSPKSRVTGRFPSSRAKRHLVYHHPDSGHCRADGPENVRCRRSEVRPRSHGRSCAKALRSEPQLSTLLI